MKLKGFAKAALSIFSAAAIAASSPPALAYQNPLVIETDWTSANGFGDPFIMRYNGMYYLYATKMSNRNNIDVWTSEDMLHWECVGNCINEANIGDWNLSQGIYAPEVKYYNGLFYMYTSSNEQYHKTLTSTSPTGPFTIVSQNNGASGIDGSPFIDNDEAASKYLYRSGIEYYSLNNDMITVSGSSKSIPAATVTGNWTEGPSVFKRGGKYYMTYTGNHFLSDSYMIEYAVGDTPTDFKEPTENRILINTEEGIMGLGHNSTVIGPDLDSRYIVYHNISSTTPTRRDVNIDRIVFNGEKLEVQGPTWWEVSEPAMPDFYDRMENADNWDMITFSGTTSVSNGVMTLRGGATALSKSETSDDYTAEFNLRISDYGDTAEAGAIASYTDEDNYAYVYITPKTNTLHFRTAVNGAETETTAKLPAEYKYTGEELFNITIKKESGTFDVYVDDRLLITADASLCGGKIGYLQSDCILKAEYTAFSSVVNGNQDAASIKPTGSAMDAVHANDVSRSFTTDTYVESGAGLKSEYVKDVSANDWLSFDIAAQETSYYSADILAKSASGAKVKIEVDGETVAEDYEIPASDVFLSSACRNIKINSDSKTVKITVTEGTLDLYSVTLSKLDDVYDSVLTQDELEFEWLNGYWNETDTTISTTNSSMWSTASYGREYMGDYEISSDITLKSGTDAGFLVRLKYATGASDKDSGVGNCQTADYHQGYYVYMNATSVGLGKQVFNWTNLKSASASIGLGSTHNLKARVEGANIKVYLDDQLVIDYTDTNDPLMEGKVGMRAFNALADYQNIVLTHLNPAEPINEQPTLTEGATALTKTSTTIFSDAQGKGYRLTNGNIMMRDSRRSVKGYINGAELVDGSVSCDIEIPAYGYFSAGILVRCKESAFGNTNDSIDGIGVQLVFSSGYDAVVSVYNWQNKVYKGTLAQATLKDYFADHTAKTAHLEVVLDGDSMDVYIDGVKQLSDIDISAYPGGIYNRSVGFRLHQSTKITLKNFTYSAEPIATDYSELNAEILSVQELDANLYTSASMSIVTEALEAAQAVANNSEATQTEINDAQAALAAAVKKLVKKADFTTLNQVISQAESLDASLYTADSMQAVTEALEAALAVAANDASKQTAINSAANTLTSAINSLVKISAGDNNNTNPGSTTTTPAVTNGTATVNGKTVLYVKGKQVIGTKVVTVSGKTYAVVGGYVKTGKKQVVKIGGKYYIVNASGVVQKGTKNKLIKVGTKSYVVNKNGVVQRKASGKKLVKVGTKSYIVNKLGVVQKGSKNKLVKIGKKAYIVNKKGVVQKNKKKIKVGKKTYKTNKKGVATLKK